MVDAVNYSNNVGHNGPVCIYSTGQTCLSADKRFWFDETGVHVHPAQAAAEAHTTITNIVSIKGRKFVEKIAWRRAGKQIGPGRGHRQRACRMPVRRAGRCPGRSYDPEGQRAIRGEGTNAAGRAPRVSRAIELRHARLRLGDPWHAGPGIAIGRAVGPAGVDPPGRYYRPRPRVDDQQRRGNRPHGHAT